MAERIYAKDPVAVRDTKKWYAVIIFAALLFLSVQLGVRFYSTKHKSAASNENLPEDKGRLVFKEADIVRSLEALGRSARESALKKAARENRALRPDDSGKEKERLGPDTIVTHDDKTSQPNLLSYEQQKPLGIPLGTQVLALLKTRIFSFNVENHVEAEALKDVYYLGKLGIPKGTKFFGTVSVLHSENRVNIRFYRLLLPSGEERNCLAVAHALDGSGGIKGKVNRHWFGRTFQAAGKTALSAMTLLTVPNRESAFSLDDQLRLNAASNLAQEGARELQTIKTNQSIEVKGGIMIKIIILESF